MRLVARVEWDGGPPSSRFRSQPVRPDTYTL
jgi:hypothetical protein